MSKRKKALEKLRNNPKNVRPDELCTILVGLGFTKRQEATSHAVYKKGTATVTVPYHKPFLKPKYVELAVTAIDETTEQSGVSDAETDDDEVD